MDKKRIDECDRSNFTLVQSIRYEIKIAGNLGENWPDWLGKIDIHTEIESPGLSTTVLTGTFDQAGLIGLLRQLYSLGYPLISVNCIQMHENQGGSSKMATHPTTLSEDLLAEMEE